MQNSATPAERIFIIAQGLIHAGKLCECNYVSAFTYSADNISQSRRMLGGSRRADGWDEI